jgi:hypothetical protein
MSAQIDNVRSAGSSFSPLKFAGALAKYRELGVNPYLLFGGQHFDGCFANGAMLEHDSSDPYDADEGLSLSAWDDENADCDSPLKISAQQVSATGN